MDTSTQRRAAAVVLVVAVATYAVSVGHPFTWDDGYNVVDNASIRTLSNIPGFFTEAWGASADDAMSRGLNTNYYRPVSLTSYALDHAVFGLWPAGWHAVNVALHALISLLVLALGLRLFASRGATGARAAWLGALLFAVHPVHSEAVNVITYRTDLLAALFTVAGAVVWLGPPGGGRDLAAERRAVWLWVPLLYALGLGSKEMAAPLPGLLFLADWWLPRARALSLPRRLARMVPLAVVLAGYLGLRVALLTPSEYSYFGDASGATVAFTMLGVFGRYVQLLVWPWPLNPFYDWSVLPPEPSLLAPGPLVGLALLVAWLVAIALTWRRRPAIAWLLSAWILLLLPVSQVLPVVVAAGERFLYLACAGPLLLAGLGLATALERPRLASAARVVTPLVLLLLAGLSVARSVDWRSDRAILEANVRDWPASYNAWYGLARLEEREGHLAEALAIHERLERAEDVARLRAALARAGTALPAPRAPDTPEAP